MRGKRYNYLMDSQGNRITPADAGKTRSRKARRLSAKDHPRGCGENDQYYIDPSDSEGSPPRMRGKREYEHSGRETNRITPADAGKTSI